MIVAGSAAAIAFVVGLRESYKHTVRVDAANQKFAGLATFDKSKNFGEIWVDGNRCIRWTAGATAMLGWDSKEQVGTDLANLNPHESRDFGSVFRRNSGPWVARGPVAIKAKDGEVVTPTVIVLDAENNPELRMLILLPEDVPTVDELGSEEARAAAMPAQAEAEAAK